MPFFIGNGLIAHMFEHQNDLLSALRAVVAGVVPEEPPRDWAKVLEMAGLPRGDRSNVSRALTAIGRATDPEREGAIKTYAEPYGYSREKGRVNFEPFLI